MNYTVKEVAKKLKVSEGCVYDLVKKGELNKVPCLGRIVRIPGEELKKIHAKPNKEYFSYNPEKVEIIETSLGKIRKIKYKDFYVITDIVKAIGISDSYTITRAVDKKFTLKLTIQEAREYGFFANQFGILLIHKDGIKEYSTKSRDKEKVDKFIQELKIDANEQIKFENKTSFEEQITEQSKATEINQSNIQIFENSEFGQVRTILEDKKPWFIGREIAELLGYADTKSAISDHVDLEDRTILQKGQIATLEIPNRGLTIINESGLYSLILSSKLPTAKKFKRWVTSEVLPQIRKTGGYIQTGREKEFTDNYFSNFSEEIRKQMLNELSNKNAELFIEKEKIDSKLSSNIEIMNRIEESFN